MALPPPWPFVALRRKGCHTACLAQIKSIIVNLGWAGNTLDGALYGEMFWLVVEPYPSEK